MQLKISLVNFLLLAITNTIVAIFVVRNNIMIYIDYHLGRKTVVLIGQNM